MLAGRVVGMDLLTTAGRRRNETAGFCSGAVFLFVTLCVAAASAQEPPSPTQSKPNADHTLDVNWLYGAYIGKDVELRALTGQQRFKLYLRQTFTTPGIYAKTVLFTISDQINDSPPEWGSDFGGFARRLGSREGQFVVQNSLTALGDAALGYEPRYDRCRCSGFWPRTRHALLRNFVTYNRTEKEMRPRIPLYAGAFGAGVVAGTWKPDNRDLLAEGYRGAITQVGFGCLANWVGEFAPDIMRVLKRKKTSQP